MSSGKRPGAMINPDGRYFTFRTICNKTDWQVNFPVLVIKTKNKFNTNSLFCCCRCKDLRLCFVLLQPGLLIGHKIQEFLFSCDLAIKRCIDLW